MYRQNIEHDKLIVTHISFRDWRNVDLLVEERILFVDSVHFAFGSFQLRSRSRRTRQLLSLLWRTHLRWRSRWNTSWIAVSVTPRWWPGNIHEDDKKINRNYNLEKWNYFPFCKQILNIVMKEIDKERTWHWLSLGMKINWMRRTFVEPSWNSIEWRSRSVLCRASYTRDDVYSQVPFILQNK